MKICVNKWGHLPVSCHFIYNQSFASYHPSYWFGSGKSHNFWHCKILQGEKKSDIGKPKFKSEV